MECLKHGLCVWIELILNGVLIEFSLDFSKMEKSTHYDSSWIVLIRLKFKCSNSNGFLEIWMLTSCLSDCAMVVQLLTSSSYYRSLEQFSFGVLFSVRLSRLQMHRSCGYAQRRLYRAIRSLSLLSLSLCFGWFCLYYVR